MRTLLVLIKREIVDDAACFVAALGISIVFLLGLGGLGFVSPKNQQMGVVSLLFVLPTLAGMSFFLVGVLQGRTSRTGDVARHLSTYPVSGLRCRAATTIAGALIAVVTVAALAIGLAGGIITGIIEWPESLFPGGLVDLMVGVLLVALSCYSLGLLIGRRLSGGWIWLVAWPAALALVSLIIIKGLGPPLIVPLAAFSILSLLCFLIPARWQRTAIITQGLLVLMMITIPLYWLRIYVDTLAASTTLEVSGDSQVSYWGFPVHVRSNDVREYFTVQATVDSDDSSRYYAFPWLDGIMQSLEARQRGTDRVYSHTYFDAEKGLFIKYDRRRLYAGPRAVAAAPSASLGTFKSPIVCVEPKYRAARDRVVVFDPNTRCFYMIDFAEHRVRRGPPVSDDVLPPVDATDFARTRTIRFTQCGYPSMPRDDEPYHADWDSAFAAIMDRPGNIAVLDLRDLTLIPHAGHLPGPRTLFGRGSPLPEHGLDYLFQVVVKHPEETYAGLAVACLPPLGAPLTVTFVPENGGYPHENWLPFRQMSLKAPLVLKGVVEGLHPPVLTLASFFMADRFEAGQAWRTLLFMPNSLVAQQRDREAGFPAQFAMALVFMLPAVFLAALLAWRVAVDARRIGLPGWTRRFWLAATLAFGLPAYIIYCLIRPKVMLLICRNCGQARRADQEQCHRCGKGWQMPGTDAPAWRVSDAGSQSSARSAESNGPAGSTQQKVDLSVEST